MRNTVRMLAVVALAAGLAGCNAKETCTPSEGILVTQVCPYEDGHPNGEPCVWTDPDTGKKYVVDSSEYRN